MDKNGKSTPDTPRPLSLEKVKLLTDAGAITASMFKGTGDAFSLILQTRAGGFVTLQEARGDVKTWKDLTRAFAYLKFHFNIENAGIEGKDWSPYQRVVNE